MRRGSWILLVGVMGTIVSSQAAAEAIFGADVVAYADVFPPDIHGGEGQTVAEWAVETGPIDVGTPIVYFTQWAEARAYANAGTHELKAESLGAVTLWSFCDPCSASTPFGWSRARLWDTITIPPGSFPNGAVVEVDVVATLSGHVTLHGTPSGGSEWGFDAFFGPSFGMAPDNLFALDLYSGGLNPPYVRAVGPLAWIERVEVTVGQTYRIWGELLSHVGGSGFYGFGLGHYENSVDFYPSAAIHLQYVPGYEDVTFVSAAGAEVLPVPEAGGHAWMAGCVVLSGLATSSRRRGGERTVNSLFMTGGLRPVFSPGRASLRNELCRRRGRGSLLFVSTEACRSGLRPNWCSSA